MDDITMYAFMGLALYLIICIRSAFINKDRPYKEPEKQVDDRDEHLYDYGQTDYGYDEYPFLDDDSYYQN